MDTLRIIYNIGLLSCLLFDYQQTK